MYMPGISSFRRKAIATWQRGRTRFEYPFGLFTGTCVAMTRLRAVTRTPFDSTIQRPSAGSKPVARLCS